MEEWGSKKERRWKSTKDFHLDKYDENLGPMYDTIKEKMEMARKNYGAVFPTQKSKEHKNFFQKFLDKIGW